MEHYAAMKNDKDFSGVISNYTVWGRRGCFVSQVLMKSISSVFHSSCALEGLHTNSERWSPGFFSVMPLFYVNFEVFNLVGGYHLMACWVGIQF